MTLTDFKQVTDEGPKPVYPMAACEVQQQEQKQMKVPLVCCARAHTCGCVCRCPVQRRSL